jgi:regulator of extracellular matrix RemA (YlzA/DUF370 family)
LTGNITSLARVVAEARAEHAQVERISALETAKLNGQIAAAEQRIESARLAGEQHIVQLREQIVEVEQRLAVSRDKLSQAELRFDAARGVSSG